ncbi:MAG: sigma-70 family RNA polymerase sigma factor [bacterium]|nr:MAG: sigma-70 family RNA polymerase sigma factor [bacterium]
MKKESETKLVKKAKQGDRYAFGKLVKKYQNKVLYLAYDLTGNYIDAQDVAQNVFLQAFQNIPYFRDESSFSTWIYKITTNAAIDFQRSRRRRRALFIDQPQHEEQNRSWENIEDPYQSVEQKIEDSDLKDLVSRVVEELSPQQKAAFVLKYFHDKSTEEIAKIIDCDPVTVRGHILRATVKLRKKLKDER